MGDFRGLGRKVPISDVNGWNHYWFGTVIACPNAMAAPGTTFHPKTQKSPYFTRITHVLVNSTKIWYFRCFGGRNWSLCGHRVWTSYSYAKFMIFASLAPGIGICLPKPLKSSNLGDFHGTYLIWLKCSEMEWNAMEFHQDMVFQVFRE